MDQFDPQQNFFLEMMKQHISNGLSFQSSSDGETSSHVDENESITTAIVYKKRARIKFSPEQLDILESTFEQNRYPSIEMIDELVERLNLPTQKITVWFQNRRARLKKSQEKIEETSSLDREEQIHSDSGIQLDDETSRASSTSPPYYSYPSNYYLPPPHHQPFYNPMWQNFNYPVSTGTFPSPMPYQLINDNSPFLFHDVTNYPRRAEFYG